MAKPKFKQRCAICKNNMVVIFSYKQFPICVDCHMKQIDKPIEDAKAKKLFNIPEEFYRKSVFLRNIKGAFIRFGKLSEKQIEAFKKTVKDIKNPPKEESETKEDNKEKKNNN